MTKKGREFNEIYDLTAMRVLVGSVKDCYGAIGVIHSLWKPLPGRFKDWVAMPKFNMYQALHTTVIGPEGRPLEIQIRTQEMHDTAEYGIAAHWMYKEDGAKGPEDRVEWLKQLVDWQKEMSDPQEFAKTLKADLFDEEVFVFTPRGEVKSLGAGATPLDFAYAVHTDVGHRCVGAKVNGKIVPLQYELQSGDICEVLTSKKERGPSRDWLQLAKTTRAQSKIRAWFKAERREDSERTRPRDPAGGAQAPGPAAAADRRLAAAGRRDPRDGLPQGRRLLRGAGRGQGLGQGRDPEGHGPPARGRGRHRDRRRGGRPDLQARAAVQAHRLVVQLRHHRRRPDRRRAAPGQVLPPGARATRSWATSRWARASRSTTRSCSNAKALMKNPERFTAVSWDGEGGSGNSFRVELEVDGWDRTRLLEDLSRTFAETGVNILEARCTTVDPMVKNRFVVEVGDLQALKTCIGRLRNIESVFDAYRVTPTG